MIIIPLNTAANEKEILGLTIDIVVLNDSNALVTFLGARVASPRDFSFPGVLLS